MHESIHVCILSSLISISHPMAPQLPRSTNTSSSTLASTAAFSQHLSHEDPPSWAGSPASRTLNHNSMTPSTTNAPNLTYLMPTTPPSGRRGSADYRPSIKKAQGHVPACLVNASLTYYGNDQIYAFGGFDQYTDEGIKSRYPSSC